MNAELEDKIFDALGPFWWTKTRGGLAKKIAAAISFDIAAEYSRCYNAASKYYIQLALHGSPVVTAPLANLGDASSRENEVTDSAESRTALSNYTPSPAKSKPKKKRSAKK